MAETKNKKGKKIQLCIHRHHLSQAMQKGNNRQSRQCVKFNGILINPEKKNPALMFKEKNQIFLLRCSKSSTFT